jgi:hypothetical protein
MAPGSALHQTVAIKQLDKHGFQGNKEFLAGVAKLSQLHHENLIDLVGYCADGDQRLLVYESVPAGTLEDHLFGTHACPPALARSLTALCVWRAIHDAD